MRKLVLFTSLLLTIAVATAWSREGEKAKATVLENGYYFNGKAFEHFGEIVIKDGKIWSVTSQASKQVGNRIPLNGKYVIPGLTDAHVHISGSPAQPYVYSSQTS